MQRRRFMNTLAAATAATPLMLKAGIAGAKSATAPDALDPGRWSPFNAARLQAVLDRHGVKSARYDAKRRPYAVFDWDNTCIMNDCEEALLMYQINHLQYKLTPDEFVAVMWKDVPKGAFMKDYTTVDGKPVTMEDLAADVESDYRWLHANYKGLGGDKSLDEIRETDPFKDFRAKLYFMYDAICDTHPLEVGYKWIIYFYKNMTTAELQAMAEASNNHGIGDALRKVRYESPKALPGKAGVVADTHFHGIRIHEEIRAVMHTLRANGIDVYVSTASLDDVVRVFAGNPNYGYGVPPENVIGLRLDMQDGKYTSTYPAGWHFNWGPGKTVGIRNVLASKKGYGPLLVFGDSDGDAWMLRDFKDTAAGVIVNRMKKGEIGADSKLAAEQIGNPDARFLLQGRDEHTGLMIPDEKSIKYGKAERKLLA
ncbi:MULTISPECIES: haloacid dehalogenase-like hydrolase [Burkholderia]|uniref:haloacid dehalogenase-like hydrolase n=1 Tax=Burkholderia TaxID=32008 RepID=UPI000678FF48|nr:MULTISPECIES: haloacid dehalogenase-like hydrolase [Burkholderia]KWU16744.1 phosphoserine phosphatase [Burkholderia cenocepacia]OXI71808.1 haloacid dehalogenase-like hydrolase [Burkholderia sp. AU31280]QRR16075.1 haloacid dehalogenase-like hydrolase [Burkholderia sp. MS389]QVN14353.1 haloacid dehalogenase-like hydrolase [Burkholderia sp. LAS2]RQU75726.1 haloacid dehalogenase-like hydrolase [Burkholderia cenocepacia]